MRQCIHKSYRAALIAVFPVFLNVIFSVDFFNRPRKERSRYTCIVHGCNDIVRNPSRHLQCRKHDWSKESAKAALHAYGLRKSYPNIIL